MNDSKTDQGFCKLLKVLGLPVSFSDQRNTHLNPYLVTGLIQTAVSVAGKSLLWPLKKAMEYT